MKIQNTFNYKLAGGTVHGEYQLMRLSAPASSKETMLAGVLISERNKTNLSKSEPSKTQLNAACRDNTEQNKTNRNETYYNSTKYGIADQIKLKGDIMDTEIEQKRFIRPISFETQELIRRFSKCKIGDIVTNEEMSKIVMGDIRNGKQHCLQTAIKRIRNDELKNFETIRMVGVKFTSDDETIVATTKHAIRAHRMFKKGLSQLRCVDPDRLDNEGMINYNSQASILGVLAHATKRKSLEKIEAGVKQSENRLMLDKTLEMFKSKQNRS